MTTLLTPLSSEPTQITAGDSVCFVASSASQYPASQGWAIAYRLFGPMGSANGPLVDKSATAAADNTVSFAATDTAIVVADGSYRLVGRATNATTGEAVTLYDAICRIVANPLTTKPANLLTHAETALAAIEAAIEKRLPADMESYQIDGKLITKIPIRDLMRLRAKYRLEVWRGRNPGLPAPQRLVRFTRA